MKIFITGSTGFVGSHLVENLLKNGHRIIAVASRPHSAGIPHDNFEYLSADTTKKGPWQNALADVDAVINLAGRTIFKRWTKAYKQSIYDSRVLTTRHVVEALPDNRDITFCSASAVGYYGNRKDDILSEKEPVGKDFLAAVCRDWEAEAFKAEEKGVRVIITRFGVILGRGGGALSKMVPAFKLFVGGPMGHGRQWFPWIHMEDLISAIVFVLGNNDIRGPANFCSPHPIQNRKLAKTLGRVLRRPSFMPAPALMVRLALGEFGEILMASQRAVPESLIESGFGFRFSNIEDAVRNIIQR